MRYKTLKELVDQYGDDVLLNPDEGTIVVQGHSPIPMMLLGEFVFLPITEEMVYVKD